MTTRRERRSERSERYEAAQRMRRRRAEQHQRQAFEDAVAALLHRVSNRPVPEPEPDPPPSPPDRTGETWWSPRPIFGYRLWELRNGSLHGAWTKWESTRKTARCLDTHSKAIGPVPHDASECRHPPCGIYAMKWSAKVRTAAEHIIRHSSVPTTVAMGLVALTGRVIEHERGYRAEHAEVVALAILTGGVGKPAVVSRVPDTALVEAFDDPRGLRRAYRPETVPIHEAVNLAVRHLRESALATGT